MFNKLQEKFKFQPLKKVIYKVWDKVKFAFQDVPSMTDVKNSDLLVEGGNDFIVSELNAESIYDWFILNQSDDKNLAGTIISIEGTYGSGKSTIKEKLKKKFRINETILVDYVALQHEEPSQVTSQLYMKIGDKLGCENKHLLSACAVLKKENMEAPYISGNVGVVVFILCLITLWFKIVYNQHYAILHMVKEYALFAIFPFFILVCFNWRDNLVRILSGFLPRYTHIKILEENLQKSEFDGKTLILLIDEIDRLDSTSVKLLLDEILILHEILAKRGIKHKFFLFYNPDILVALLDESRIPDVDFYLQKHKHQSFIIYKPDFLHELHYKIFTCKPSESIISSIPIGEYQNIFANPNIGEAEVPSSRVLYCISKYLRSFRDLDRFIAHIISKSYVIQKAIVNRYHINNKINNKCLLDLLMIEIFFAFKYNLKTTDINLLNKADSEVRNAYDQFLSQIGYIYSYDSIIPKLLKKEPDIRDDSRLDYIMIPLEEIYYEDTKIYPSKIEDGKVSFNIDAANNLENIFSKSFDEVKWQFIVEYINCNLGEFNFSKQANYPHLRNLECKDFLVTTKNCKMFLELVKSLEDKLLDKSLLGLYEFIYSYSYSTDLYNAAINSICYCFCKLIPTNKEDHELVINEMIEILQTEISYCSPILFLVLHQITLPKFIYSGSKNDVERLFHFVEKNVKFEQKHALFLFEYYKVVCQRRSVPITFDLGIDQFGNISNDGTNFLLDHSKDEVITDINGKLIDETFILFFLLGITIYSFNEKQKDVYLLHSEFQNLMKNNLYHIFNEGYFEEKKGNDFYRAAYNMWKAYCGEPYDHFKPSTADDPSKYGIDNLK